MPAPRRLPTALLVSVAALAAASLAAPSTVTTAPGGRTAVAAEAGSPPPPAPVLVGHPGTPAPPAPPAPPSTSPPLTGEALLRRSSPSATGPDTVTTVTNDAAATATFQVTYVGFPVRARADFQRAVDIWSHLISSSVPITVSAHYEHLGAGIGGQAGPSTYRTDFRGAPQPHTFYAEPLANELAGRQIDPSPDIVAHFTDDDADEHFGTGPIGPDQVDFASIVLHELGHGLGFLGAATVADGRGAMGTPGYPLAFDRYTRAADGRYLLSITDPADLAAQLQSGTVSFDSPQVRSAGRGAPARLSAPAPWDGSSYSHLDEDVYPVGDPDELMTPVLQRGHVVRAPGPLTLAVLRTIGW